MCVCQCLVLCLILSQIICIWYFFFSRVFFIAPFQKAYVNNKMAKANRAAKESLNMTDDGIVCVCVCVLNLIHTPFATLSHTHTHRVVCLSAKIARIAYKEEENTKTFAQHIAI